MRRRERIELFTLARRRECLIETSFEPEILCVEPVCVRVARVQLECTPIEIRRCIEVPIIGGEGRRQRHVCFRQIRIDLQRAFRRRS